MAAGPRVELDPPGSSTDNAVRWPIVTEPDFDSSARCAADSDMRIEALYQWLKSMRPKVNIERDGFHKKPSG